MERSKNEDKENELIRQSSYMFILCHYILWRNPHGDDPHCATQTFRDKTNPITSVKVFEVRT